MSFSCMFILVSGVFAVPHLLTSPNHWHSLLFFWCISPDSITRIWSPRIRTMWTSLFIILLFFLLSFCRNLYYAQLTGTIPDSIGNLKALQELYVQNPKWKRKIIDNKIRTNTLTLFTPINYSNHFYYYWFLLLYFLLFAETLKIIIWQVQSPILLEIFKLFNCRMFKIQNDSTK